MKLNFIINGAIIAIIIILVWVVHAYNYRTSKERLCTLALSRYMQIVPAETKEKFVILCDQNLSRYMENIKRFYAVFTFTPDDRNKDVAKENVYVTYDVVSGSSDCELAVSACGEVNRSDCSKPDAKQVIVRAPTCINID